MSKRIKRNPHSPLSSREYGFVVLVGLLALAITSVPYVLGAALTPPGRVFGGFVYALQDCYSYLGKMRLGAEGDWLFHIFYTPEPSSGTLFFPLHLLLGKMAALVPIGDLTTRLVWGYHAARWVCGLGLLVTVYRFLAAFTTRVAVRRVAWLMVTFGGGLGWLLVALVRPGWLGSQPLDFILPEGFTFLVLYAFPHIALGRTLLLWGLLFLLQAWLSDDRIGGPRPGRYAALTGLVWLLMGLIVPFYVAVAWAVMGAAWLLWCVRQQRVDWRKMGLAAIPALLSAPVVAYSAWIFTTNSIYAVWAAQNQIVSPHPLHYLMAYGPLLVLGGFAVRDAWRARRPLWLPLAWVGVVPFLIYLPFNLQRRLVEGVQVPLSLLAALGLMGLSSRRIPLSGDDRPPPTARRWMIVGSVLFILSLTNLLLVAGNTLALRWRPEAIYRRQGEVQALDWLAQRAEPDDVALSAYETGNYLPVRVHARVFVGHGPETVDYGEKRRLMHRFFDPATDHAWRQRLLREYSVDYVFWGPAERREGAFDPQTASYLHPIYESEPYLIFEVCP